MRAHPGTRSAQWASRRETWRPSRLASRGELPASRVSCVALLAPWITMKVIAEGFPESRGVRFHEREAPDPLRTLPEIEMRHKQARGSAVSRGERDVIEVRGNHCPAFHEIRDGVIRGVAPVTVRHDVVVRWRCETGRLHEVVEGDPTPSRVQFAPLRDAVDVDRLLGLR